LLQRVSRFATATLLLLSGCGVGHELGLTSGTNTTLGETTPAPAPFGYAVADEPQAALVGQQILAAGGNAADAAAAEGFALAVTLPSRAALGGGGACILRLPNAQGDLQPPVALLFPAGAPALAGGARPAAVPLMARGLLALQAGYGTLSASADITPAERLAVSAQLSPALESDLQVVGPALLADPVAASLFAPNGALLPADASISQPDLAGTLATLSTNGSAALYTGSAAQNFATAVREAGGQVSAADLGAASVHVVPVATSTAGTITIAALPTAATTGPLPASAAFMALDKNGGVVACAVSTNNLFGTGRFAPGTGVLLAAAHAPAPLLAAEIAYNTATGAFRAAATGTGQQDAATAAATGLNAALTSKPAVAPGTGRTNIIACPGGVPGGESACTAHADPRGQGLAAGGN